MKAPEDDVLTAHTESGQHQDASDRRPPVDRVEEWTDLGGPYTSPGGLPSRLLASVVRRPGSGNAGAAASGSSRVAGQAGPAPSGSMPGGAVAGPSGAGSRRAAGLALVEWARMSAIGRWAAAALDAEPDVIAWRARNRPTLDGWLAQADLDTLGPADLERWVHATYLDEGGAPMVEQVRAALAEAHQHDLDTAPPASVVRRMLPDGRLLEIPASETVPRPGLCTLRYPLDGAVASLEVLRDGQLGALAAVAEEIADRYLLTPSDVVGCIVTGAIAATPPVRLGLRFRRFWVEGIPVTATSKVTLEVDPQLDAAELARVFAQWQQSRGISDRRPNLRAVQLAGDLVGRVTMSAPEAGHGIPDIVGVGDGAGVRGRPVQARPGWTQLARDLGYEPRLVKRGVANALRLLKPLDLARNPDDEPDPVLIDDD